MYSFVSFDHFFFDWEFRHEILSFSFLVLLSGCFEVFSSLTVGDGVVRESNEQRLSILLVERWMDRSATIKNDKELEQKN